MKKTKLFTVSAIAVLAACSAYAGQGEQAVRDQLKEMGCGAVTSAKTSKGVELKCNKGGDTAIVILDPETEEVVAQGMYRGGQRIGEDVIPDKHHKDDGVKYGDQDRDDAGGNAKGETKNDDDGAGGGSHSHDKTQKGKD